MVRKLNNISVYHDVMQRFDQMVKYKETNCDLSVDVIGDYISEGRVSYEFSGGGALRLSGYTNRKMVMK